MIKKHLKDGVVLLVTIMLILLLMGIVSLFLKSSHKTQKNVNYISALNQTNFLTYSLLKYIKTLKLTEEVLFYAAQTPIPLSIEKTDFLLTLDSAQNKISLSDYISSMDKNSFYVSLFVEYLQSKGLDNPMVFLDILKKSKDQNMQEIFDIYFLRTSDNSVYKLDIDEIFFYNGEAYSPMDINFLNYEQLHLILSDANTYILKTIAKHEKLYTKFSELPFSKVYLKQLEKKHLLQSFTTKTSIVKLDIDIKNARFRVHVVIYYDLKNKVAIKYSIGDIELYS